MPDQFDQTLVLNQLRYSGMLETVKIRRTGFPVRRPFQDFCSRFASTNALFVLFVLFALFVLSQSCRCSCAFEE